MELLKNEKTAWNIVEIWKKNLPSSLHAYTILV